MKNINTFLQLNSLNNNSYSNGPQVKINQKTDIAGSYSAMQRAGRAAEDLAIRTNTAIITTIDGKVVRLTAEEIIKKRQAETSSPGTESE